MTANPTNYLAMNNPKFSYRQGLDPVRARVTASQQLTNDQLLQAEEEAREAADRQHLLPDTRRSVPQGPHPGDILYWVTCVGGACLLLLEATI